MSLPFERRKDEGPEAFEAFSAYRDMGVSRSTAAVARTCGKHKSLMDRWSSTHAWVRRAAAWDAEVDRRKRLVDIHETENMRKRQIRRALKMQELSEIEINKMLSEAQRRKKKRGSLDEKTVLKLSDEGAKLERVNRGEPGEIVHNTGDGSVDLTGLSLVELKQWKAIRAKVKARQLAAAEREAESDDE